MKSRLYNFLRSLSETKYILDELVITFFNNEELMYFMFFMKHFCIENYEINIVDGEIQVYMNDILNEIGIEKEEILKQN